MLAAFISNLNSTIIIHIYLAYIGDHISVPGERFRMSGAPLYRHHMIVVEVISRKKLHVIHYRRAADGRKAVIKKENIAVNPSIEVTYRIDYNQDESYTGQEAIDRALERLGECSYNLLSNNCESFCTWVKMNKNKSAQAETGIGVAAGAVVVGVVGAVAVFTIAVLKAFSGK